jgi:hypothetical protein
MVKCGVFFAVRTEFLNIILMSFGFKGLNVRLSVPVSAALKQEFNPGCIP